MFKKVIFVVTVLVGIFSLTAAAQVAVTTYHNDIGRTGQNLNETVLTPSNVNVNTFGKVFSYSLPTDSYVYAQPLYLPNVAIPNQGTHNVLFIATERDVLYAFDADGKQSSALWSVDLAARVGGTTVTATDVAGDYMASQLGVSSTPAIDPATGTIYVLAYTKEGSAYVYRLHALDVTNGAEKFGGSVKIQGSVAGTGDGGTTVTFNPATQNGRPSLLLANGNVYISFASYGDNGVYHGWVFGYSASTLQQIGVFNTTPNGSEGSAWALGALAADASGSIYTVIGNGTTTTASGGKDLGESTVRLNGSNLSLADYFTPYNYSSLNSSDADVGSGGILLLPDQANSPQHLAIGSGKEGRIYLLNRDNLGHFNSSSDQIVQEISPAFTNCSTGEGCIFGTPAYWNNYVYFVPAALTPRAFQLTNGKLSTTPVSTASTTFYGRGATPSISANGNSNGILWAVRLDDPSSNGTNAILYAYDATNLGNLLYSSDQNASRDGMGVAQNFLVPTIANGKVYVATRNAVTVYGLLAPPPPSTGSYVATMRSDANLVITKPDGSVLWSTGTQTSPAPPSIQLTMQDDGNLVIYTPQAIWSTSTVQPSKSGPYATPGCTNIGSSIAGGQSIPIGSCLVSPSGRFELVMQSDDNLVLYDLSVSPAAALWNSGTAGGTITPIYTATMQSDANFVLYKPDGTALWSSGTHTSPAPSSVQLAMQDDGNLVIYAPQAIWSTSTAQSSKSGPYASPGCRNIGSSIVGGQGIVTGSCLVSPSGRFELVLQSDDNLVLYDLSVSPARALWNTGTAGGTSSGTGGGTTGTCPQPSSPGVVICSPANGSTVSSPVTISAAGRNTGTTAGMDVWIDGSKFGWFAGATTVNTQAPLAAGSHQLDIYADGTNGESLKSTSIFTVGTSTSGGYLAVMQSDANFVITKPDGTVIWSTGTHTSQAPSSVQLAMQDDGNLVIYAPQAIWSTSTVQSSKSGPYASPGCTKIGSSIAGGQSIAIGSCLVSSNGRFELVMQSDDNLVLYDLSVAPPHALWSSGTAGGTASGTGGTTGSATAIKHVIFMMQENRSFDNYFGMLNAYRASKGWNVGDDGKTYLVDGLDHSAAQIINYNDEGTGYGPFKLGTSCIDDLTSAWLESYGDVNKFDFSTTRSLNMDGYVHTAEGFAKSQGLGDTSGKRAMGYYDQNILNYYYFMASEFAVSDRWFSPVSSKTVPNRIATMTGGTTQGLTKDPSNDDHLGQLSIPTIFQELDNAGVSWKIYYTDVESSGTPSTSFTYFTYANQYIGDTKHLAPLSQFYTDVQNGTLPAFAYIEPGFNDGTDEHPGVDIVRGQQQVANLINALMNSVSWKDSVFFLSYDEGGPFDHVPPVPGGTNKNTDSSLGITTDISSIAVNPDSYKPCPLVSGSYHCDLHNYGSYQDPGWNSGDAPAQQGFAAQLGFRVPNLVISPFTRRHYVSHVPMDHTAIIKFVENRFIGSSAHLTARDAAQPNLLDFFDFTNAPWAQPPAPPTPATASCNPSNLNPAP